MIFWNCVSSSFLHRHPLLGPGYQRSSTHAICSAKPFRVHCFLVTVNSAVCPTDVALLRDFSLPPRAPLSKAEWIATMQHGEETPPRRA